MNVDKEPVKSGLTCKICLTRFHSLVLLNKIQEYLGGQPTPLHDRAYQHRCRNPVKKWYVWMNLVRHKKSLMSVHTSKAAEKDIAWLWDNRHVKIPCALCTVSPECFWPIQTCTFSAKCFQSINLQLTECLPRIGCQIVSQQHLLKQSKSTTDCWRWQDQVCLAVKKEQWWWAGMGIENWD